MGSGLLQNIENYRELLDYSQIGVFTSTIKGKYIEVNHSLCSLLGYRTTTDLLNIEDIDENIYAVKGERKKIIKELFNQKGIMSYQTTFVKKDGTIFPVKLNLKLIKEGNDDQIAGTVEDLSHRTEYQKDLDQERQTLLSLIEKIPDYIYLKNSKGDIILANSSVRKLIKSSSDKKNSSNLLYELFYNDEQLIKNGDILTEKLTEITSASGIKDYISLSKYPLFDNDNNVTGLIGIGRNLNELKQAERQIIKSQSNLHALIESSNELIWSVDNKFEIITYNSSFANFIHVLTGKRLEPGQNSIELFEGYNQDFWKRCFKFAKKGEKLTEEISFSLKGGALSYECSFNPILNKNYNTTGISIILSDITERKSNEEFTRESEERFRQLAENTTDAFVLWDRNGVLYANPSFEKIYGIRLNEIMRDFALIENAIDIDDRKRYLRNRKKEMGGKSNTRNQHYRLNSNKKNPKKIWSRHYPVYNHEGKVYRYMLVTSDVTTQTNLEEVLTATRSQQQALLDNIPFFAWLKDKSGRYISVNHPFSDFYQLRPEDIIGKTDFDLLPQEVAKKNTLLDREVLLTGEKKHIEDFRRTLHGEEWVEIYKSPIYSEKGEVIGLTGISREITDRKRLEEAIKKNEEHFRALLQYSSDAITILDKDGIIVFESSLRNRILNFTVEEMVGKSFSEIIHPDDIHLYREAFHESIENPGIQIKKEFRSLHKNMKWIYVESIFTNHLDNPSINGIVINTRDVSDRKMAELKEKAYHNNLIFLSNSALELLSLSDKENIYQYISDKLHEFLENSVVVVSAYSEQNSIFTIKQVSGISKFGDEIINIIGRNPIGISYKRDIGHEEIINAGNITIVPDILEFLDKGKQVNSKVESILDLVNANKVYNIILARHNKLLGCISIITLNKHIIRFKHIIETFAHQVSVALHRSQLESELIDAKTKAEESDRLKTAFLANMSHEIRTPMNGILGFAEMLNDVNLPDNERKKYLNIINNNGKVLITLIDDIIDFAKIEAGQVKIINHDFSLNALLSQIYSSMLTDKLKREKPEVKLRVRKAFTDEDSFIHCDPNRLRQVITNLIGNAFKFTTTGYIEFGYTKNNEGFLEFYVEDTGIGIAQDKIGKIFDRFVQADNSRSRKYSGSGLGLAISKGFVELFGGKMWAESQINKGSKFYFTIPHKQAKTKIKEKSPEKKPRSNYNWSDKKFLVAEDDFFSYKFLEGFLKQTKAQIIHADDGRKAVELCKANPDIDVILMDVQMPDMNGLDATRNIKAYRKDIPIIAQTANAIAEERQKCFEAGFDDFVTKPINISELFMKIDHWLARNLDK